MWGIGVPTGEKATTNRFTGRFTGAVESFAKVDVAALAVWIKAIPLSQWPQQTVTQVGQLRPSMVSQPDWHDFKAKTDALVDGLMASFPGGTAYNRLLSVVMPGDSIEAHKDEQPDNWLTRVHVPLSTCSGAIFLVAKKSHHLEVGKAYRVNTLAEHEIANTGKTPRIHFMFDVRG